MLKTKMLAVRQSAACPTLRLSVPSATGARYRKR
jgi:hypothetical protein